MPISFEPTDGSLVAQAHYRTVALEQMRPISRRYDDAEHTLPREWVDYWWKEGRWGPKGKPAASNDGFITVCLQAEQLCWGDAGLYLRMPTPALGGSAVSAAGTKEQQAKFMAASPMVTGLDEVMDWPAVWNPDNPSHQRLWGMIEATLGMCFGVVMVEEESRKQQMDLPERMVARP